MKRLIFFSFLLLICFSCTDEPSSEYFYTFTGEMASDYITSRSQYSDFAKVVDRAGLTSLLGSYGHLTCFVPDNDAFALYYASKGISSVDDLSDAECDTIARTHIVSNIYSTYDMLEGTLPTSNMNGRYIQVTYGFDSDSNSVVFLNRKTHIYYELRDDSVENGIMQPIDGVLESSTGTIGDILKENPDISLFYNALVSTGLYDSLLYVLDESYDSEDYPSYTYTSDYWHEIAYVPNERKYGFTVFVEPNEVYNANGIYSLEDMYDYACSVYDDVYPDDKYSDSHSFECLTDRINPLNRFVAYHILSRDVIGYNVLTGRVLSNNPYGDVMGIKTDKMNPIEWYETLLPHTMMKFEKLTVSKWQGAGVSGMHYINRRYDDSYAIEGILVSDTISGDDFAWDAINGRYFYVNDILSFNTTVRDKVQNMRIRMDFSTIFPELMTNGLRQGGDPTVDDDSNSADDTGKNGYNYYFPSGYLSGVEMAGNCYFVYRRPHWNFWSYEGDEFNLFGDYDFTFSLPPVPFSGEWQVRLGFCALGTRGVAQIYFDDVPQGIPIDMRVYLNDESIMGSIFSEKEYTSMSLEERAEDQKALKNLGYYRGPYGGYHTSGSVINEFVDNYRTYRRVLCQVSISHEESHSLRIRCTSSSKLGNNNEFMLDYLELVPKSVYGIIDAESMEDDL